MEIHHFPNDDHRFSKEKNEGKKKRKMPEFIDLEKERFQSEKISLEKILVTPPSFSFPFRYRILCLLASLVAAFWTFGGLIIQTAFVLGYLVTFFQSSFMKALVLDCWDRVCKGAAVTLTLFIAIFSPQLAIVVILSYFTLKGDSWRQGIVGRALRKHFGDIIS